MKNKNKLRLETLRLEIATLKLDLYYKLLEEIKSSNGESVFDKKMA